MDVSQALRLRRTLLYLFVWVLIGADDVFSLGEQNRPHGEWAELPFMLYAIVCMYIFMQ